MTDDEPTFASAGVTGIHYAKCWECMLLTCPGGWHTWADEDDIRHAAETGQPDPSSKRCACYCVDGPERTPEPPDFDDESLDAPPCAVCGEAGACAWDAEGRPLIHADAEEDE